MAASEVAVTDGDKASGRPPTARSRRRPAALLLLIVVLGAGTSALVSARFERRAPRSGVAPQAIDVIMTEYAFSFTPPAHGGRTVVRVRNNGKETHKLDLVPLPDDFPPIDVQVKSSSPRGATPFVELPVARPGDRQTIAVDLVAGQRYAMVCILPSPSRQSHARLGQNAEFRPR